MLAPDFNQDRGFLCGNPFARVNDGSYRFPSVRLRTPIDSVRF
jgi:hypothetical protein